MNVVMATTISEEVYTVEEVAAIFCVPADTIRRLIQRGQLPALRLGRVYRVPKRIVAQLLEQPAASYAPEELGD
jgi:excisionase family DNA binding protein